MKATIKNISTLFKTFWVKWPLSSFALSYALLVMIATALFRYAPAARTLEYALFDKIQRDRAIDSKSDARYEHYAKGIEQLCLINLDSALINPETDRVDKVLLSRLLRRLKDPAQQSQAILIDYLFKPKRVEAEKDIALSVAIQELGDKVVLPVSMVLKKNAALQGKNSQINRSDVYVDTALVPYPFQVGYTTPFADPERGVHRFYKYQLDDGTLQSVPLLCSTNLEAPAGNAMTELHFLLRNIDKEGEERAVLVYQASDILAGRIPTAELATLIRDKVVIIGLIEGYNTKYGMPIDVFSTPITAEMTGSLLLANAWLNLQTKSYIRHSSLWLVFLLNFLIGMSVILKFSFENKKALALFLNIFVKMLLSLGLFYYISLTFLEYWHIKLSLGMALLIYQHQFLMWTWWQGRAKALQASL